MRLERELPCARGAFGQLISAPVKKLEKLPNMHAAHEHARMVMVFRKGLALELQTCVGRIVTPEQTDEIGLIEAAKLDLRRKGDF